MSVNSALASCSAERLKRAYVKSDKDARGGIRTPSAVATSPAKPLFSISSRTIQVVWLREFGSDSCDAEAEIVSKLLRERLEAQDSRKTI